MSHRAVEFTLATKDDIPQLCQLLGQLFDQEKEFTPDESRQRKALEIIFNNPRESEVIVARSGQAIQGMITLLYATSTALGARVAILEDMVVRKECRGLGLGTKLIRYAIRHLEESGIQRVTLLTDAENASAQAFYRKNQFQPSDMRVYRRHL